MTIRQNTLGSFLFVVITAVCGRGHAQSLSPLTSTSITSESASISAMAISRQSQNPLSVFSPSSVQALPRVFAPTLPRTTYTKYKWKTDIVATVFWVGEPSSQGNPTPNHKSSWDLEWQSNFGGCDDPDRRAPDFRPAAFVPKQNPFYIALPYNDCLDCTATKKDAGKVVPWFAQCFTKPGKSVCQDRWLAIHFQDRVCYAQWSDCGPFKTDDAAYVFGDARPANPSNGGAGIDISPAVRDYLGFKSGQRCDWRFVDLHEVPEGPWRLYGKNNPFVNAGDRDRQLAVSRLEELRRQRDEYFKKHGNEDYVRR